jgi:hypothetical protein
MMEESCIRRGRVRVERSGRHTIPFLNGIRQR